MTKRSALILLLAVIVALSPCAAAQNPAPTGTIHGLCTDQNGKPLAGASIELANSATGLKTTVKAGSDGHYKATGLALGSYKLTLIAADGTPLFYIDNVPVKPSAQTVVDFDLAKLNAEAAKNPAFQVQRRQEAKIKQENQKIAELNALLQKAAQQKKDKQYAAAVATLEQAAAQDQSHGVIYGALADAYLLDKQFPQAETAYHKAIALTANSPANAKVLGGYHAGLALALLQQGQVEPATAECGKTAQLDPSQAGLCYYNEGAILTNQGNPVAANLAFDQAIAADPTLADAYYQKGVNLFAQATLSKDNKMVPVPGTAEALNKYLELAPDGPYAQSARDLLASIGASVQTTFGAHKKSGKK